MDRWQPGYRIGELVLERKLGQGGMGVVFQARHTRTGHACAVKRMSSWASAEQRERFLREGQAQAAVDQHPGVLRVHGAGVDGSDPYLVMELAPGGSLDERLQKGPLPVAEAAALVAKLARAMAHVHARGILHRDLKPANVLFDAEGNPKLVDFGLARIAGQISLTETGAFLGTPAYMSPEQAEGSGEVDARTDVYALGALLYRALTGSPPYVGASPINIVRQVISEEVPPPSSLRPDLPPDADAVCLAAMARDPAARTPDAATLADDLERLARGEPVLAQAPARALPRWPLLAALPLLLLIGVAAAVAFDGDPPTDDPPPTQPQPEAPVTGASGEPPTLELWRPVRGDPVDWLELEGRVRDESRTVHLEVHSLDTGSKRFERTVEVQLDADGQFQVSLDLPPHVDGVAIRCLDPGGQPSEKEEIVDLQRPPPRFDVADHDMKRVAGAEGQTYYVHEKLSIDVGERWSVPPGLRITFGEDAMMDVRGELWLLGRPEQPIVLCGKNEEAWDGIRVRGGTLRTFHTRIRGASRSIPDSKKRKRERTCVYAGGGVDLFMANTQVIGDPNGKGGCGLWLECRIPLRQHSTLGNDQARVSLVHARFAEHSLDDDGGGVRLTGQFEATLRDCVFEGNRAKDSGGGLFVDAMSRLNRPVVHVLRSRFVDNRSGGYGGGVQFGKRTSGSVRDSTFLGNHSKHGGGLAVETEDKERFPVVVNGSTFTANDASRFGGGVWAGDGAEARVEGCAFERNTAQRGGGALYADGDLRYGETRVALGGGRYADNTAKQGPDVGREPGVSVTLVGDGPHPKVVYFREKLRD